MEMKMEALKLANQLDGLNSCEPVIIKACEDMIRRLVEELDKKKATSSVNDIASDADKSLLNSKEIIAQTKLSENEIRHIYQDYWLEDHGQIVDFVRAIEERHGIK